MEAGQSKHVVLDVGKKSRKAVKRLRRGEGKVVADAVAAAHKSMVDRGEDPGTAITVVVLYEKKTKKRVELRLTDFLRF